METRPQNNWQKKLYEIIFEADTAGGKLFDVILLLLIIARVFFLLMESIPSLYAVYHLEFNRIEIFFSPIFIIEYILRLLSLRRPMKYVTSFYGVIDFLAILPTYLAIFFPYLRFLLVIRSLRLLRIFRIFGMIHFLQESLFLLNSLWNARRKIAVFFFALILITIVAGALMYMIEHAENEAFLSIPESIYWAIVTLPTVGYGDILPTTPLGKFVASFIMLLGYCIIAVPTGIVSAQIAKEMKLYDANSQTCPHCFKQGTRFKCKILQVLRQPFIMRLTINYC